MTAHRLIAVVGGGISGLAAAHRLIARDPGCSVVIFEASDMLGGKIRTERVDGFTIEAGPDAFLATKPRGVGLSEELGLEDDFCTPDPRHRGSFALRRGKLHRLPEGLTGLIPTRLRPMAETKLISPMGKIRMGLDFVLPARKEEEDESLSAFLSRRLGQEAVRNLIEPLMAGIYAGDATQLSLAATFPQLRTAEREHGGLIRGVIAARREAERRRSGGAPPRAGFLSFRPGMDTLVTALADRLRAAGVSIELTTRVSGIERRAQGEGYALETERAGVVSRRDVDAVILATPAWAAAPLVAGLDADAGSALAAIPHVSTALIALAFPATELPHPDTLHGYGYVVQRAEQRDVMAMTWLSSKWEARAPEGQVLVRAFAGRAGQEHVFAKDDPALIDTMRAELREILGINIDATPTLARVYRWDRGMPQYNLGHLDRVRRIEAAVQRLPGFAIAGNMFRGVGIPDCILSGETAADRVLSARDPGLAATTAAQDSMAATR